MPDTQIDFSAPAELRKWPSVNKQRVSASLGARPYLIGEGGTLDECIQQAFGLWIITCSIEAGSSLGFPLMGILPVAIGSISFYETIREVRLA